MAAGPSKPERDAAHAPQPVDLSRESVAGEEDPGASVDVPAAADDEASAGTAGDASRSDVAGSGNSLGDGRTAGGREGVERRDRTLGRPGR